MIKHRIQITDDRVQKAIFMYKEGKGTKLICKELKMDGATLNRFLGELGLKKSHGDRVRSGKTDSIVRHDALDLLTSEALYWIGFLYADGHIEKDRPRISITCSEVDKLHLEKFAKFFGESLLISQTQKEGLRQNGYYCSAAYRVIFSSSKIYEKLKYLGFTNRKTWDITPHDLLKNSTDFWRGCVDGDGWVINKTQLGVGLSGHVNTLEAFLLFIRRSGVVTETKPYKDKRREFLWKLDLHHHKAVSVLNLLYKDACVYLDRKYEKYLEIMKD